MGDHILAGTELHQDGEEKQTQRMGAFPRRCLVCVMMRRLLQRVLKSPTDVNPKLTFAGKKLRKSSIYVACCQVNSAG